MANLIELVNINEQPRVRTNVSGDYCFSKDYFQIRTYKEDDTCREEGQKQNIQFNKGMAKKLAKLLESFVEQD